MSGEPGRGRLQGKALEPVSVILYQLEAAVSHLEIRFEVISSRREGGSSRRRSCCWSLQISNGMPDPSWVDIVNLLTSTATLAVTKALQPSRLHERDWGRGLRESWRSRAGLTEIYRTRLELFELEVAGHLCSTLGQGHRGKERWVLIEK